jgi:prepilin-type N-terminal cleavage/methylation domain-containing protein
MKSDPIRITANARRFERNPSVRGFTLIEMVFVVVILLIMAAMAFPLVNNVTSYFRLRGAISSVTGTIQSTRYQAIFQGCPYEVVFDNAASTYQVKTQQVGITCPGGVFTSVCTGAAAACPVPLSGSGVPITLNAPLTLIFSPGGKVTSPQFPAGGINLILTYGTKPPETITVSTYGSIHVTP